MVSHVDENNTQKINELNIILGELKNDAKDFSGDMIASVYLYFVAGAMSILFGVQTGWYNRTYILSGDIIPLFLLAIQILAGTALVIRGIIFKKKYSRIFALHKKL